MASGANKYLRHEENWEFWTAIFFMETLKKSCIFIDKLAHFTGVLIVEHEVKNLPGLNTNLNKLKLNNNLLLTTEFVSYPQNTQPSSVMFQVICCFTKWTGKV